jgi:anti-anti-sigma factor
MTTDATIEVEAHGSNAAIVTLRGEHDLSTNAEVENALKTAGVHGNVVVDLSECSFLDSTVISALLNTSNRLRQSGGLLRLVIADDTHAGVRRLFELMEIDHVLPIHSSRAVAIAGLATRPPRGDATATRVQALSDIISQSLDGIDANGRAA